jgi:hypothetical protein
MLQQAYIVKETESNDFYLIPEDTCLYTLKCSCCRKRISSPGTIGETLYHAPIAIVCHWGLFDTDKPPGELDLSLMPMLFSSMDTFQRALASFEASLGDEDNNVGGECAGSGGYQTHVEAFCEAAKVDIAKTNESNTKTLSPALCPSSLWYLKILAQQSSYMARPKISTPSIRQVLLCY